MNTAAYQEQQLGAAARESGRLGELAYYHAASGNSGQLRELVDTATHDQADATFLRVLALGFVPETIDSVLDAALASSDPWCLYTAAKTLLRQGRRADAEAVCRTRARTHPRDMAALNLVVKYCVQREQWDAAKRTATLSLELNAEQDDVRLLLDHAAARRPDGPALYLEPWPKPLRLAFYVPVYNVEQYIANAIEGMFRQSQPLMECLAVNDGTEDGSMEVVRRYPVRTIDHECNKGLAAARNTAFAHTEAQYVGAVDSDAYPDLAFSRLLMMEFENGIEALAGAGGDLIEIHDKTPADRWRARHLAQRCARSCRTINPAFLYGSNAIFKRDAVTAIGGYDEVHRTNNEDVDLCRRIRERGYMLLQHPDAKAFHLRRDTRDSVLRMRWNWMQQVYLEQGKFKDAASYLLHMQEMLGHVTGLAMRDINDKAHDLLYMDFLLFFHDALCMVNHGVEHGIFAAAEGRRMQLHMVAAIGSLDQRFGGQLRTRVAHDLVRLMQSGEDGRNETDLSENFRTLMAHLAVFVAGIPESFYQAICR